MKNKTSLIILLLLLLMIIAGCVEIEYPGGTVTSGSGDTITVRVLTDDTLVGAIHLQIDGSPIEGCSITTGGCGPHASLLGCNADGCGVDFSLSDSELGITCGSGKHSKTFLGKTYKPVGEGMTESESETSIVDVCCRGTEICDGIDNNCIGGIDEGTLCTGDDVCYAGSCCTPSCPADYCANTGQPNGCGGTCPNNEGSSCGTETRVCTTGENCACDAAGKYMCETNTNKSCPKTCSEGTCPSCTPPACDKVEGVDTDGDGYSDECEECDTEPTLTTPTEGTEITCIDGIDNDCDGATDCIDSDCASLLICCIDNDGDGYGNGSYGNLGCAQTGIDCDEDPTDDMTQYGSAWPGTRAETVNPGAFEICDNVDNDCDDEIDEGICVKYSCTCSDANLICAAELPECEDNCEACEEGCYFEPGFDECLSCSSSGCTSLEDEQCEQCSSIGCQLIEGDCTGGAPVTIEGCTFLAASWSEYIVGSGTLVHMIIEGEGDCNAYEGETFTFKIYNETEYPNGKNITTVNSIFENGKAEANWTAINTLGCDVPPFEPSCWQKYYFIASGSPEIHSGGLTVTPCDLVNDADCDGICNAGDPVPPSAFCEPNCNGVCGDPCSGTQAGTDTDDSGCTQGQSTCIAAWDCTATEWSDCDEETGERTRDIGTYTNPNCDFTGELECNTADWYSQIPTVKSCIIEEEFPVFNFQNFVLVIFLLVIFYFSSSFKKANQKEYK